MEKYKHKNGILIKNQTHKIENLKYKISKSNKNPRLWTFLGQTKQYLKYRIYGHEHSFITKNSECTRAEFRKKKINFRNDRNFKQQKFNW